VRHRAGCQCGALTLEAASEPELVIACNCRACQRRTGAAFGVGVVFARSVVRIAGESRSWDRVAESGRRMTSHFCPVCGTSLYWLPEMRPEHVIVALGCLETEVGPPERVIWAEATHEWVRFPEHLPRYQKGAPPR
jgi:hypothetical protein